MKGEDEDDDEDDEERAAERDIYPQRIIWLLACLAVSICAVDSLILLYFPSLHFTPYHLRCNVMQCDMRN